MLLELSMCLKMSHSPAHWTILYFFQTFYLSFLFLFFKFFWHYVLCIHSLSPLIQCSYPFISFSVGVALVEMVRISHTHKFLAMQLITYSSFSSANLSLPLLPFNERCLDSAYNCFVLAFYFAHVIINKSLFL